MASPTDVSTPADEPGITTEQPKDSRPSRLNQALAWVGIAAGGLFIVAAVFFSGFFLSWGFGGQSDEHMGPGTMDCCSHMKPGEQMKPGAMMGPDGQMAPRGQMAPSGQMTPSEMMPGKTMGPGGMMGPGGPMGPAPQSPTTTPLNTPRP
jgi:hypothetical protein